MPKTLDFSHVAKILIPPPDLEIDEWAEQNIIIPFGGEPGPFSLDRAPFVRELFRMAKHQDVEEITLMFAAQVTKTIFCQIVTLYYMAVCGEDCLHVMPKKDDAVSLNVDRYQKMILASPSLKALLKQDSAREMTRAAIRFTNGGTLHFGSAQSASDLKMRTIRILTMDEVDTYGEFAGRDADPISLARERTERRVDRKIFKVSTPLTDSGYINQEFLAADRRRFHVPCPHCGIYQVMTFPQIKWPEEETDAERVIDQDLAWYECPECKERITDLEKVAALRRGVWCPEAMRVGENGELQGEQPPIRRLSYHLSRLYSTSANHTFSRIAAEYLRSVKIESKRMNFQNSWLAEVYADKLEELKDAHLRTRVAPYASCTVPAGVSVMTAGVDVQEHSLWYVIRGWGAYGESWLIRCGSVESWEQLALVLFRQEYGVPRWVFIDARYQGRKDEVYGFCRATGCQPIIGAGGMPMRDYWRLGLVEHPDGAKFVRLTIDTNHYKQKLHRTIKLRDEDPGAWHLPNDLPPVYYDHMTAEQRILEKDARTLKTKVVWKLVHAHARNEYFDCEVYAYAAASIKNLHDLTGRGMLESRPEAIEEVKAPPVVSEVPKPLQTAQIPEVKPNQPQRRRFVQTRHRSDF